MKGSQADLTLLYRHPTPEKATSEDGPHHVSVSSEPRATGTGHGGMWCACFRGQTGCSITGAHNPCDGHPLPGTFPRQMKLSTQRSVCKPSGPVRKPPNICPSVDREASRCPFAQVCPFAKQRKSHKRRASESSESRQTLEHTHCHPREGPTVAWLGEDRKGGTGRTNLGWGLQCPHGQEGGVGRYAFVRAPHSVHLMCARFILF